ncbi:MAG TPA: hypothetical protein VNA25_14535, partial [Phycisphaerae bacterium]|nr:hypothetical protein [Phycisphaerae bacterium]
MSAKTGANEPRPKRGFRPLRVFLISWLVLSAAFLPLYHFWEPAMYRYTGTAKFVRRVDPAAEGLIRVKSESFESRRATLEHDLIGEPAVERALLDLHLDRALSRAKDGNLDHRGQMELQELVRSIRKNLKVTWDATASDYVDLISVSFTHSDPNLAERLPNRIVHNYIAWVSDQIVSRLRESDEFLQDRVARCKRQYETANADLIGFEANYAGMMPGTPGALEAQARRIESDIDVLRRQNTLAEKKLARLKSFASQMTGPASQPVTGPASEPGPRPADEPSQEVWGRNPEMDRLEGELRVAKDVLDELLRVQGMNERHPTIQAQRRRIAQIEKRIEETPAEVKVHSVYDRGVGGAASAGIDISVELFAAQSEVEMTKNELERLESRLMDCRALLANFAPVRQEYERRLKKVAERQEELTRWEERYLEVQMAYAAETAGKRTQYQAVQAAQRPAEPDRSPLYVLLLGIMG